MRVTSWWELWQQATAGLGEEPPQRLLTSAVKRYVKLATGFSVRARSSIYDTGLALTVPGGLPPIKRLSALRDALGQGVRVPTVEQHRAWQAALRRPDFGVVSRTHEFWLDPRSSTSPSGYEEPRLPEPIWIDEAHEALARSAILAVLRAAYPDRVVGPPAEVRAARTWLKRHARRLQEVSRLLGRQAILEAL